MNTKKLSAYGHLCSLFYDATKNYAPAKEVDFYASFIEQKPGRVLEAMCGSGRLQIPLIQRGYSVDGFDNSKIMLDRCRQRCTELQITAEVYEQSLEKLALPYKYTTVTIAVGSFQLITDRIAAVQGLKNIRNHMYENSNLLIDIFVPNSTEERSTRIARIDYRTIIRLTTNYSYYEQDKLADAYCMYELIIDGIVQHTENELLRVTWYTDNELIQLLKEAHFTLVKIYEESFRSSGPSRIVQAQPINL